MALIPKFFMDAVLSIGERKSNGKVHWMGTGFFVSKEAVGGKSLVFLITNRHVLEGEKSVVIRLKEKDTGELKEVDLPLADGNGRRLYTVNPNEGVDIAAMLMEAGRLEGIYSKLSSFDFDAHSLTSEEFLEQGGDAGSMVYMLGFPMELVEARSNTPICRMGCVARMDPAEISESRHFLLDMQTFPGNSGSPVVTKPELTRLQGTKSLEKAALIGIVYGHLPYKEYLMNIQTKSIMETRSENSGIALANPVEYIMQTVELELIRVFGVLVLNAPTGKSASGAAGKS